MKIQQAKNNDSGNSQESASANSQSISAPMSIVDNRVSANVQLQRQMQFDQRPQFVQLKQHLENLNQHQNVPVQRVEEEEPVQGQFDAAQRIEEEEPLQAKFADIDSVQRKVETPGQKNNTGLPSQLKAGIESLSGMSMDHVKVHYNSAQPAQLNAHAYAQGSEIHIAPGQEQHLPHEAWHVVQQAQGRVKPTMQMKGGVAVNDDVDLETEADVMGAKSLALKSDAQLRSAPISFSSATVQRTEADAIAIAHALDITINDWAGVIAARGPGGVGVAATLIDQNWPQIIAAYVAPPPGGRATAALIIESNLLIGRGEWALLQRIKEASELLDRLQEQKLSRRTALKSPNLAGGAAPAFLLIQTISGEIAQIELAIDNLQQHFMMATRTEGAGSAVGPDGWISPAKKATVLGFSGGSNLELHNKINPDTQQEEGLGKGGFGYGRFGKVSGASKFVKKIRLRTERNIALSPARIGGVSDPYALPADLAAEMAPGLTGELKGLRREAELTRVGGLLAHPNILATEAAGIRPGKDGKLKAYMVMEKMAGDVSGLIKTGNVSRAEVIGIIRGTLAAVVHMHANNYLHRDIKPDNIMLDSTGAPKLIDFGTAALMVAGVYNSPTAEGTREFMHPTINVTPVPPGGYDYRVSTDIHALKLTFSKLVAQSPTSVDIAGWVNAINVDHTTTALMLGGFNFV